MNIVKTTSFRSKALVNMTDDMVRITIDMTRHEWRWLKKLLEAERGVHGAFAGGRSDPDKGERVIQKDQEKPQANSLC